MTKYFKYTFLIFICVSCGSIKNTDKNTAQPVTKVDIVKEDHKINIDTIPKKTVVTQLPKLPENTTKVKDTITTVNPINAFNHSAYNELLKKHVHANGTVNYKGFKKDKTDLKNYINALASNVPSNSWKKADKLAYWINAYNALTIDLILRHYPIKSIKNIDKPWEQRLWKLGNKWYNLNEIEHSILRNMNEPRIHFGIVCASISCPKLLNIAFTPNNLERLLTKATKDFLSDPQRNIITEKNIKISKIFQWFAKDFKQNGSLIDFLNKYSEVKISDKAKKTFKDYNWNLNE